jgi:hypothetical protein
VTVDEESLFCHGFAGAVEACPARRSSRLLLLLVLSTVEDDDCSTPRVNDEYGADDADECEGAADCIIADVLSVARGLAEASGMGRFRVYCGCLNGTKAQLVSAAQ